MQHDRTTKTTKPTTTTTTTQQPVLSPQIQQCLTTLGVRTNDFLQQVNTTINALIQENQQLQTKLKELQAPIKEKIQPKQT
jgi:predicted transcriptional regulator